MLQQPNSENRFAAVVVGLGQVGSRFDEEPGRKAVWSHVGAYLQLADRFVLSGAVEVSADNTAAFRKRCPRVPVYDSVAALNARHRPQIASICTPTELHGKALFDLLACPDLRLIWCEKPLSIDLVEARRMVDACRDRGVVLMVSFNRRWYPLWRRTRVLVQDGCIGELRSVRVALPNRLFTIGAHAVDLALMLGGHVEKVSALALPSLQETGEPAVCALLRYDSGASGIIQVTGLRQQLMVEAEIIGDDGRLLVREDNNEIRLERFAPSDRFSGYRQLAQPQYESALEPPGFSAFVAMAENAAAALIDGVPPQCDGAAALEIQRILGLMSNSAD
jgi:predicted dehydrogenase